MAREGGEACITWASVLGMFEDSLAQHIKGAIVVMLQTSAWV